jgi:hypothetical protein
MWVSVFVCECDGESTKRNIKKRLQQSLFFFIPIFCHVVRQEIDRENACSGVLLPL